MRRAMGVHTAAVMALMASGVDLGPEVPVRGPEVVPPPDGRAPERMRRRVPKPHQVKETRQARRRRDRGRP